MNLDFSTWKSFSVSKILTIMNGKGITKEEIAENAGSFEVVQSGENNNGVIGKIDLAYCKSMGYTYTEKPCLTVARSGSAGFVSFQINGCAVGDSAKILLLDDSLATTEHYVFLQSILMANKFKYTYGRKVTEEKYMNDLVDLPIQHNADGTPFIDVNKKYSKDGYVPDWQFMEDYIKSLNHKPLTTKNKSENVPQLDVENWKEFRFGHLIQKPYKAKSFNKEELDEISDINVGVRYITRTGDNNGCELIANKENIPSQFIEKGNAISIGDTTATCFYQAEDFIAGDHMVVVRADWLNKLRGIFIVSILQNEQYKYSYGRAFLMDRISDTVIKLPVVYNTDGTLFIDAKKRYSEEGYVPDWKFMENYIKSLPYGDRL